MARILSIDYGKKRTGIAVTDPLQIIAGGLATVSTSELFDWLKAYLAKESVERIIIGEPRQPNGQPSENLQRVQQFVNRWRKAVPEVPIELCIGSSGHARRRVEEESPSGQGAGRRNLSDHHPGGLSPLPQVIKIINY